MQSVLSVRILGQQQERVLVRKENLNSMWRVTFSPVKTINRDLFFTGCQAGESGFLLNLSSTQAQLVFWPPMAVCNKAKDNRMDQLSRAANLHAYAGVEA